MIPFDTSEVESWAGTSEAKSHLPTLIRNLILATVPTPSFLDMPSGSSVWSDGWDGVLEVDNGNSWVPQGTSAWEFSARKDVSRKATEDYQKRTNNPQGIDTESATFVFVTPRKWKYKDWIKKHCQDGDWVNIRVLDAADIVAWLESAPTVARQFAQLIGKIPASGFVCLNEWWENWTGSTQPRISSRLVLAGRHDQAKTIQSWFTDTASCLHVQGDTREETTAFLAASALCSGAERGSEFLAKAVVVQTLEAWQDLQHHHVSLVLIRSFVGNVSSSTATGNGHHVLILLDRTQTSHGSELKLSRLGREETIVSLTQMGITESKARLMSQRAARRMPVMRRMLLDEAGVESPEWMSPAPHHTLVAIMLIGQWNEAWDGDRELLERLAGKPYTQVDQELSKLANMADAPVAKLGEDWSYISRAEAWYMLAPYLASSDIEIFRAIAIEVLGRNSPQFDLPPNERYLAPIRGKILPYSDRLLEGITQTLALMGTQPELMTNIAGSSNIAVQIVEAGMRGTDNWQNWATLGWHLRHIAEAAPDSFLDAVDNCLIANVDSAATLFQQDQDPLFGGAPHVGLLSALERLAWSANHFASVVRILARLADIDPGGVVVNRPLASLAELFRSWIRFTEATDADRITVLERLLDDHPISGWKVLVQAFNSTTKDNISHRNVLEIPQWRTWGPDGVSDVTQEECLRFHDAMCNLLLTKVGGVIPRWLDLIRILPDLPMPYRQKAIEYLKSKVDELTQNPDLTELRTGLRRELHHHRSYPDSPWAMSAHELELLDGVYEKLTPANTIDEVSWLFDHSPCLTGISISDFEEYDKQIAAERQEAIRKVYSFGGKQAILDLLSVAENLNSMGTATASCLEQDAVLDLALGCLETDVSRKRAFARSLLSQCHRQSGWGVLNTVLTHIKSSGVDDPLTVATVYFAASPRDMATCLQKIQTEDHMVQKTYWSEVDENFVLWSELNNQDFTRCVSFLLATGRSQSVAHLLNQRTMSGDVIVKVLEQIPLDRACKTEPRPNRHGLDSYRIARLFELLDADDSVTEEMVARLEILYIHELRRERRALKIYEQISRVPSLFAGLICNVFKRSDGQEDEIRPEVEKKEQITGLYYDILNYNGVIPGLGEDGEVDVKELETWVTEVRRLCTEMGRQVMGDQYVGQLLANAPADADGMWPCEPVRNVLDAIREREHVAIGFKIGKFNLRGVTTRTMYEGGEQERRLAKKFREDAERCRNNWPFTARLLRQIADRYDAQAIDEDMRASGMDEFGII